ncbi:hypothetical protein C8T65DRAFT_85690 [Cerioporus squamosus]|nr:hypothetical protein C8T65DRAFT_85690 [Cerioporus squamosus]
MLGTSNDRRPLVAARVECNEANRLRKATMVIKATQSLARRTYDGLPTLMQRVEVHQERSREGGLEGTLASLKLTCTGGAPASDFLRTPSASNATASGSTGRTSPTPVEQTEPGNRASELALALRFLRRVQSDALEV